MKPRRTSEFSYAHASDLRALRSIFLFSVFTLEYPHNELPLALIGFIRLLLLSDSGWTKAKDKGRLPKPKVDFEDDGAAVVSMVKTVLNKRLGVYAGTLEASCLG